MITGIPRVHSFSDLIHSFALSLPRSLALSMSQLASIALTALAATLAVIKLLEAARVDIYIHVVVVHRPLPLAKCHLRIPGKDERCHPMVGVYLAVRHLSIRPQ